MIEFKEVTKVYGDKTALNQLNLAIESGEIVGLIGHNGAGKSTTIKSLVSVINPTSGTILVDGADLADSRLSIKKRIGYVADSPDLFLRMSADEFWDLIASAYELTQEQKESQLSRLMSLFDLTENRYQTIESFSHGMRQKVFLIGALLPNPDIWVLDEPMTGLDPQAAFDLKELMRKHADEGNTVIFSTHVLEVAEQICDRIAILKKGELIYFGTIAELKALHPDKPLESIYLGMAGREAESGTQVAVEEVGHEV
ncbi:ABC transporter ATP-binding protein [Streptococcus merionis]|uniref:ABC-type multidrug transporter, ATPase n=1 Tax=Streptococcus merionis TaxID=400065 RepID=A0A239SZS6_9STRE|nr:ABC transporter ATP-binding protein [Streptococcus merionis]SNU90739.1 ABC-type multidrug transporter, ATPase [Streptococcus merionis]